MSSSNLRHGDASFSMHDMIIWIIMVIMSGSTLLLVSTGSYPILWGANAVAVCGGLYKFVRILWLNP